MEKKGQWPGWFGYKVFHAIGWWCQNTLSVWWLNSKIAKHLLLKWWTQWWAICPPFCLRTTIWQTHTLAHSGKDRIQQPPATHLVLARHDRRCEKSYPKLYARLPNTVEHGPPMSDQANYVGRRWQSVVVYLIGPWPETAKGNNWALVHTYHITFWQPTLAILDSTTSLVAIAWNEWLLFYLGLHEHTHIYTEPSFNHCWWQDSTRCGA